MKCSYNGQTWPFAHEEQAKFIFAASSEWSVYNANSLSPGKLRCITHIFFMNCEQAKKYRIMLLTTADPSSLAPMGIEAYTDMAALLAAADIADKDILLIPNGSTVVPYPKA